MGYRRPPRRHAATRPAQPGAERRPLTAELVLAGGASLGQDLSWSENVKAIGAEPDGRRMLTIYAGAVRQIQARLAPLLLALRDASATEPEAKQVWREISDRPARNTRTLAEDLNAAGGLRPGLSVDEAADVIWAANSSELYVLLTIGPPTACWLGSPPTTSGSPRRPSGVDRRGTSTRGRPWQAATSGSSTKPTSTGSSRLSAARRARRCEILVSSGRSG